MGKKILKSVTVFLFLMVFMVTARPQGIKGEIRDMNGEAVPYAAIFIKELTRGTTCNALGLFSLPLPEGSYTIFFRSLGYTEVSRTIEVGPEYTNMVIELPPQTYMIPEVRISASGEDPAYWIMRKTIGLANYHLHEVLKYDAEIYIKGSALLEKLPRAIARRIQVNNIRVEEGEAYMLESLNEVQFTAPDKYEMRVIASQNTLPGYAENVNPMDYINTSLYQQQIEGFISPLARNAFSYYRFKFDGTFLEGTYIINKIKVIPRRKSQQICEGYLYIVEDLWCLHSADLSVNTIAGTVTLQQIFANIIMDAWLPVNHKIGVDVDIAGVLANVTYVSSLEYSDVTLNPNLPETYFTSMNKVEEPDEQPDEQPLSKEQEKINELLQKEELTNRDVQRLSKLMEKEAGKTAQDQKGDDMNQTGTTFSVADSAVKNDSLYWNTVRPIPLTPEEHLTLKERDSIIGIRKTSSSSTATDSIKTTRHRQKRLQGILMGRTYTMSRGKFRFSHDGLIDLDRLDYNTVDGISYGQTFRINWKTDSLHTLRSNLVAEYAFHRKAPVFTWNTDLLYAPLARGKVALYLNYTSSDFNGSTGIPGFTNMAYTLFLRENYMKKYEQIDATLYNRIDVANGWVLTTSATFGRQNNLVNNNDFSFFNPNDREFTTNTPGALTDDDPSLTGHHKMMGVVRLDFTPTQPYVVRTYRKDLRDSKWPTFSLEYRHALPLENEGWSDFSLLSAGIRQTVDAGLLSTMDWSVGSGYFLNSRAIHFSDYRHFKSSPLYIDMAGFDDALMLMDYYEASTSDYWVNADVKLTSSYLLIKFLPWFSERLWKESLGVTYLYTPQAPHYIQMGYSLNELFFLMDLGLYVGFQEGAYKGFGARLNFRF
ncbi:MAG: DUF5686 and carboxypeptidase regulatory-like domain-containing protein [Bacteroidales bacterium]|nr:DUF5686 and carboxypeptidase regulatory-like domain-containing protein [Bacteroidales bacterium]